MKTNGIVALSALAAIVAAVPLNNKRQDGAYSTTTDIIVETVWTTTTVWVDPTATPTQSVGGFFESYSQPSSTSVAPVATPVAPSSNSPAPAPPASTSTTSTYVPPPVPAPTTSTTPVAQPATSAAPAAPAAPTAASSSGSSGQGQYSGDITYYDVSVGTGSCGWQGSNSDNLVAIASDVMQNGPNPNDNPKCGQTINIYYNGNTHTGTVYDTCPTCDGGSIDLTQELFNQVAPDGDGRVHGVSWSFA